MVEELLHYFCCFECNSLFAIGCVKGCSKHVSSVVAAARYCSLTPCRFHPFSKHPIEVFSLTQVLASIWRQVWRVAGRGQAPPSFWKVPGLPPEVPQTVGPNRQPEPTELFSRKLGAKKETNKQKARLTGVSKQGVTTFAWRPGWSSFNKEANANTPLSVTSLPLSLLFWISLRFSF